MNRFSVVRRFAERPKEGRPATVTMALPDYHLLRPNAVAIPMRLRASAPAEFTQPQASIAFGQEGTTSANLSEAVWAYLASRLPSIPTPTRISAAPSGVIMHEARTTHRRPD